MDDVPDFDEDDAEDDDEDLPLPPGLGLLGQLAAGVVIVIALATLFVAVAFVLHRLFA